MRISDWSSDVCSSDLSRIHSRGKDGWSWTGKYQSLASGFRAKDRHPMLRIDPFHLILANNLMKNVINFTVWFALVFWAFLETSSVFVTGMIVVIYLVDRMCTRLYSSH